MKAHHEVVAVAFVNRIQEVGAQGLALSFMSLAELYEGVFYSRDPRKSEEGLQAFLRGVELLGLDDKTTRQRVGAILADGKQGEKITTRGLRSSLYGSYVRSRRCV